MTNNPGTGVPGNAIGCSILNIDVAFLISQACCACCLNAQRVCTLGTAIPLQLRLHSINFQIQLERLTSAAGNATVSVGPAAQKVAQANALHNSFAQDNGNSLI